ncbi:MAG: 50S ribosomal protein L35 [Chloroflexi bacterium]|jgi:large subunit ribosomal protein L35|nr:50S ribosomal protein L35 [Chloroflexota bacterium]
MPKLKTHKGAKKRIHFTGTGKILRMKQGKSHFRRRKPAKVKGLYDETIPLHKADIKRIKKLLPYQ